MKQGMYAIFFRSTGLEKALKLKGQIVSANWYITKCLLEILQKADVRGLMLHHDNISSHGGKITIVFLEQNPPIKLIKHSSYSFDLTMCDFWLFFLIKKFSYMSVVFILEFLEKCSFFLWQWERNICIKKGEKKKIYNDKLWQVVEKRNKKWSGKLF